MKVKQEQIDRVCRLILEHLKEKKLVTLKVPEAEVYKKLAQAFSKNVLEEDQIDQEAKRILEETLQATSEEGMLDRQKMFLLIKRKLAKDRGFIL